MKRMKWLFCFLFYQVACCYANPCVFDFTKRIDAEFSFSGLVPIDAIYVINLDERPECWEVAKAFLGEQGLKAHRFSAVNGWKLPEVVKEKISGPYGVAMRGGEYGCLLSHLSVLKNAYERGLQIVWILEDDMEFLTRADEIIPELLAELEEVDSHWDVLYTDTDFRDQMGGYTPSVGLAQRPDQKVFSHSHYLQRPRVSENLYRVFQRFGLTSYIVSARGLEKIYRYFLHNYIFSPIDIDIHYIPNLLQYCPGEDYITNSRFGTSDTNHLIE